VSAHSELEKQIIDILAVNKWMAWLTHGPRDHPYVPGMPDILAVRDGRLLAVEVKILPDKLSAVQVDMIESLHRAGVRVLVVTRLQEVETFIADHTKAR
jgi:predicted RecB family endonuclease